MIRKLIYSRIHNFPWPRGCCLSIYLRDGEKSNPGHQDQSHGVKPAADVGKNPQRKSKLDWVQHVLYQEETTEFYEAGIQFGRGIVGKRINFVLGNRYVDGCKQRQMVLYYMDNLQYCCSSNIGPKYNMSIDILIECIILMMSLLLSSAAIVLNAIAFCALFWELKKVHLERWISHFFVIP